MKLSIAFFISLLSGFSCIGLFILATLLFSKIDRRRVCVYSIWFASLLPFLAYRFSTAGWLNSFKSVEGLLLLFALASVILYLLLPKLKLASLEKYLPRGAIAVAISGIVGIICAVAFNIIFTLIYTPNYVRAILVLCLDFTYPRVPPSFVYTYFTTDFDVYWYFHFFTPRTV